MELNQNDTVELITQNQFNQNQEINQQNDQNYEQNNLDNSTFQQIQEEEKVDLIQTDTSTNEKWDEKFKLKTRRQSQGLKYFNRNKPNVNISVGSIEDWYIDRMLQIVKRRKLNDDVSMDQQICSKSFSDAANHSILEGENNNKLNKSYLHEDWLDDFKKEQEKKLRQQKINEKKRKRSRSKSPTPQKSPHMTPKSINSQKSVSQKGSKKNNASQKSSGTDSEEERQEYLKMKLEVFNLLEQRDEPLTVIQISYSTNYAKKYCEEILNDLIKEKKIKGKELAKGITFYCLSLEYQLQKDNQLDLFNLALKEGNEIENNEIALDHQLNVLEKFITEIKKNPTTQKVEDQIQIIQNDINKLDLDINQLRISENFLGESQYQLTLKMQKQYLSQREIYKKRRHACLDMIEFLEENNFKDILKKIGFEINKNEEDEVMKILDLYKESETEEEEEESPEKKRKQKPKKCEEDFEDEEEDEEDEEIEEEEYKVEEDEMAEEMQSKRQTRQTAQSSKKASIAKKKQQVQQKVIQTIDKENDSKESNESKIQ